MRKRLLIPFLLVSVLGFGQNTQYCCSTSKVQAYVTELTQCEKDELKEAQENLAALKERILVAHGKPVDLTVLFYGCGDAYYINTFGLYDDSFVIEKTEKFIMTCQYNTGDAGSFIYQTTNN